ncbi:ABC transporter permease [Streptomyces sp. 110]|uniref:ABC transporter permease n=1 Tax=Streptomyces endocoffeicus TaxID=2898945 RepID=A0ABS1Q0K8_9ACTN|nr:ABC transporter permease [Streptomyces endocoffeicus]MBL1118202.1 ABC transporter permease [Streptomyces endocoffeicus]
MPELAALLTMLVSLVLFFSLQSPQFLTQGNILNLLTAIAVTGIIAIPGTMLLIAGRVDLSVGSGTAFCGVMMASIAQKQIILVAVLAAAGIGILIGLVNGVLVTVFRVNALIATLGMMAVLRGLTHVNADGGTIAPRAHLRSLPPSSRTVRVRRQDRRTASLPPSAVPYRAVQRRGWCRCRGCVTRSRRRGRRATSRCAVRCVCECGPGCVLMCSIAALRPAALGKR